MRAHLVPVRSVVELRVEDHERASLVVLAGGVVAVGTFAYVLVAPVVVGTRQFHASVGGGAGAEVQCPSRKGGRRAGGIHVGPVGILRAEDAHLIATVGGKSAVAHEEVVVLADVLYVGAFAADVISAGNALAEVGVGGEVGLLAVEVRGVGVGIVAQARLLVQAQHEYAAAPRTVGQPQFALLVEEGARVDAVGPVGAPRALLVVAGGHAGEGTQCQFHVRVLIRWCGYALVVAVVVAAARESAHHHGPLIGERPCGRGCREQDDDRGPIVAVQAQVHTPLLHPFVPHDVGRPHVAVHPCLFVGSVPRAPGFGVQVGHVHHLSLVVLHLCHGLLVEGRRKVASCAAGLGKGLVRGRQPFVRHQVRAGCHAQVGAPDVEHAVVEDHRRVVDAHHRTARRCRNAFHFVHGQFCLGRHTLRKEKYGQQALQVFLHCLLYI